MEFNKKEAYQIYLENESLTLATQQWCEQNDVGYEDKYMHRLKRYVTSNKDETIPPTTGTTQDTGEGEQNEVFMPKAWDTDLNRFLSIDEYCDKYGLPKEQVRSSKLVAHLQKHMIYNIAFNPTMFNGEGGIDADFIEEIVKKHIKPIEPLKIEHATADDIRDDIRDEFFDRLVITDLHINMSTEGGKNTSPLYDNIWNEEELFKRLGLTVDHVLKFQMGKVLYIDDLGDYMDGLEGKTTRKGHDLPQVVSDKQAFDMGVRFKVELVDKLMPFYTKIVCNNITNDNHSFLFGYFVNSAVKSILEQRYPTTLEYNILEKFIEHYKVDNHTFIISHGKESGEKKFGMKPFMDSKVYETIDHYCKNHKLYDGNYLEFGKGDSHQRVFDTTTSDDFAYHNYGAFSPPSNWVTTNFKNTKSSFDFFSIHRGDNIKINVPYIFK